MLPSHVNHLSKVLIYILLYILHIVKSEKNNFHMNSVNSEKILFILIIVLRYSF